MFEIRVICDPDDTDRVIDTLGSVFITGSARRTATRDGDRTCIYLDADHRRDITAEWPTPEQAYATAPSIISEIGWVVRTLASNLGREFWLRKAALLDRIALGDEVAPAVIDITGVTDITEFADAAIQAARQLMDIDNTAVICDPRHYVRQQYARWITCQ
ncbi:hypothetical protein ACFYUJ_21460 [Streptomyces sp. NPDC004520]|uniref:hypothetical protein n=1 Tax=Streptomyces sp. NPDC004520 TaxID=3364702 RepID=UPI0036BA7019